MGGAFITQAFCNLLKGAKYLSFAELISALFRGNSDNQKTVLTSLLGKEERGM